MPRVIVAISGKRKSGKDFCASKLAEMLRRKGLGVAACGVSHSLKKEFAEIHKLDYEELLKETPYKEKYRKEMIEWGESIRRRDPAYFCRSAASHDLSSPVLIVPDCRRPSDYLFFESSFPTITVRITASDDVKTARGWVYTRGIDDAESECALDGRTDFDFVLNNNSTDETETLLSDLCQAVFDKVKA